MRSRASRLLVLAALLLPAAVLAAELLPHGHAALEVDHVAHEVSLAVGDGPCRPAAHWDASEPLHHPACAACAWIARPTIEPLLALRVARPEAVAAVRILGLSEARIDRPGFSARGRAPPAHPLRPS